WPGRLLALVVTPDRAQVLAALAVELQPALALQEDDEHQPVEELLRKEAQVFAVVDARDLRLGLLEDLAVVTEELVGDGGDIERLIVALLDGKWRQPKQVPADTGEVQHGDALGGRAQAFAGLDGDAAEQPAGLGVAV